MPEGKDIHVLVVDDEISISKTLALILSKNGFTVSSFTDPLKALDGAPSRSPDVLLTDVVMPHLSGIDLAIQIKEKWPPAKFCCFLAKLKRWICLGPHGNRATNFRSSPSLFTLSSFFGVSKI